MKNLVKKENPGKEMDVKDIDAMARSKNYEAGAAHMAPLKNNALREKPHFGGMPKPGSGKF